MLALCAFWLLLPESESEDGPQDPAPDPLEVLLWVGDSVLLDEAVASLVVTVVLWAAPSWIPSAVPVAPAAIDVTTATPVVIRRTDRSTVSRAFI